MSLNLTQVTLDSVSRCRVNTVSTSKGMLSYATSCIGIDAVDASSVQCYSVITTADSTCESILQEGINVDTGYECSNTCQVSLPATHLGTSMAPQASTSATSSGLVETSDVPTPVYHQPAFSTNPPFHIATYTLASPNATTNICPSFIITFIALFFILFFVKK